MFDKLFGTKKMYCPCGAKMKSKKGFKILNGVISQDFFCEKCGYEAYVEERLIV